MGRPIEGEGSVTRDIIYLHNPRGTCGRIARQIADRVAAEYGLTFDEMTSPRKTARLVRARWHVMWELYDTDLYSTPAIAALLKLKDHTTVLHGIRQHQSLKMMDAA
jgi:chromosomal replication initiation ATPase DnaA